MKRFALIAAVGMVLFAGSIAEAAIAVRVGRVGVRVGRPAVRRGGWFGPVRTGPGPAIGPAHTSSISAAVGTATPAEGTGAAGVGPSTTPRPIVNS